MITKNNKVVVSLRENVATLNASGKYASAILDKEGNLITKSKTLRNPIYKNATRTINLGYTFLEMALNLDEKGKSHKPKPPRKININRFLRSPEGKLMQKWNQATDEDKIKVHLDKIAYDLNCTLVSFDIL